MNFYLVLKNLNKRFMLNSNQLKISNKYCGNIFKICKIISI